MQIKKDCLGNGLISLDPVVNINRPVDHTPEDIQFQDAAYITPGNGPTVFISVSVVFVSLGS